MDNLFQETAEAAKLLNEFYTLTQKDKPASSTAIFFDKDYLTIAEFLAPVGDILKAKPVDQANATIQNFITSSLGSKRKQSNETLRVRKTLKQLLNDPKSETINEFLNHI